MNRSRLAIPVRWQWPLWWLVATFLSSLLGLALNPAFAAGSITSSVTAVKLYRGATIVLSSDPNSATYRAEFTAEACRIEKQARARAEAVAKVTGNPYTAQWKCQIEERDTWSYIATPTCPAPRAPETRQTACPNDAARTFTQTRTWTIAPHPECEAAGAWLPATPSATDCPAVQLPLVAPAGVTATADSTSVITVRWNVVPDAVSYQVKRCIVPSTGTTCTELRPLICARALTQTHVTLPPGTTVRYQVAASRASDCTGLGADSAIVQATTLTNTTPPPPTACTGRVCTLSWSHDGPVADGFRVVYGESENELVRVVQVTPGSVRTTQVTMPHGAVWYFGVKAYIGASESAVSNLRVHTVQ